MYDYQVLSLMVEVMKKDFRFKIGNILHVMRERLKSSAHAAGSSKDGILKEAAVPLWKEAYYSLILLENILQHFPELYFEENVQVWFFLFEEINVNLLLGLQVFVCQNI